MTPANERFRRRDLLKSTAAAGAAALSGSAGTPSRPNLITVENARPGTTEWQLTRVRINEGQFRTSLI